jgi:endogenous inhibitor of DNA gyrase (YacG/DUF329 family)
MLPRHQQAMRAIEHCRTPTLGGHLYTCPDCGKTLYQYHSCRNRHCPKCQNQNAEQWLAQQQAMLLPVPYFMLTFTLPDALRTLARSHQRLFYDLLFRLAAAAVQQLARDPRFLGGQVGLIGVLHTWTRKLLYHPHVHFLALAGGLTNDGQRWRPARTTFLLPVKALSRLFRAKFRAALRRSPLFDQIPRTVWAQEWVVHCQPVGNGRRAFKYLAPYIFRVALCNNRLVRLADDQVTFRYRTSDTGQTRLCTLPAEEFIRRFLQHVLPKAFVKVRYYGFFAPGQRSQLAALRQRLGCSPAQSPPPTETPAPGTTTTNQPAAATLPHPVVRCPICGQTMQRQLMLPVQGGQPP